MRVLTVGNMYPPHALGGYELTWRSSVADLRARARGAGADDRLPRPGGRRRGRGRRRRPSRAALVLARPRVPAARSPRADPARAPQRAGLRPPRRGPPAGGRRVVG